MPYTCEKCSFTTHIKTHYNRHLETEKHKINCSNLSQQLADLKKEEAQMKAELKIKEIEQKHELKMKEKELKEQIKMQVKTELLKAEEKMIKRHIIEKSISMINLMERIIDCPEIEDYCNIFNGAITFEELFMRDFVNEYEDNKSIVLEKGGLDGNFSGYYINNCPCIWWFHTKETLVTSPLQRFLTLIPLYHKYLKEYAKDNGCNVKEFYLTPEVQKDLEQRIIEHITYIVVIVE